MKILILTDHSGHTEHNSVYTLARSLALHPKVESLSIATRGDARNTDFFQGKNQADLWAIQGDENFAFPADPVFKHQADLISLREMDIIFLRLPRPIAKDFFSFLANNFPEKQIINRPSGIKKTSSKAFLLQLSSFTPPIALCKNLDEIIAFKSKFECVLKPLEEYGGKGIVRINGDKAITDGEELNFEEFSLRYQENPQDYLAMKFLKNVSMGDKRIVVAGNEVLAVSLRLPAEGNWLCNVAQGGKDQKDEADERELEIIRQISPILLQEGIFYYGLDTLVDDEGHRVISEINTLSIGGIGPAERTAGIPLAPVFVEKFIQYCQTLI